MHPICARRAPARLVNYPPASPVEPFIIEFRCIRVTLGALSVLERQGLNRPLVGARPPFPAGHTDVAVASAALWPTAAMTPRVWTLGHSTRSFDEFAALLAATEIEMLADVRRYPRSRRLPHCAREALADSLAARALGYVD